jgi:hypothetical protein
MNMEFKKTNESEFKIGKNIEYKGKTETTITTISIRTIYNIGFVEWKIDKSPVTKNIESGISMLGPLMNKNESIKSAWEVLKKEINKEYDRKLEEVSLQEMILFIEDVLQNEGAESIILTPRSKDIVKELEELNYEMITDEKRELLRTIGFTFRFDNPPMVKEIKHGKLNSVYEFSQLILKQLEEYEKNTDPRVDYQSEERGKILVEYLTEKFEIELRYKNNRFYFIYKYDLYPCDEIESGKLIQKMLERIEKSHRLGDLFEQEKPIYFPKYAPMIKSDFVGNVFKELRKYYSYEEIEKMSAKLLKEKGALEKFKSLGMMEEAGKIFDIYFFYSNYGKKLESFKTRDEFEIFIMEKEKMRVRKMFGNE